ncbi:flagellar hook-associated protein FlgK [Parasphingorhabdus cellanae]|uniref:Flagellar hook-associated protein 1 n=1 Tax=Parasphingorhabdus cellanae TaxID=2806553 RepID=A0ABX7T3Q6_9SPHN|nr:flagellar hook-associated protein FlgK [Parasphingorhabdus cellanae]QTD55432.1 flagellar hook-associated protein FlgK [Parasphingorhabdus cellanae]
MSDLLSIGRSALLVNNRALEIVGSNVANAENPDYVRRTLSVGDTTIDGSTNPIYRNFTGTGGVAINGIVRASDQFLEAATRQTGANRVQTDVLVQWLDQGEIALANNQSDVGSQLTQVFASAEELSAVPFEPALRSQFLGDIQSTVSRFNQTASNLSATKTLIDGAATQEVTELNAALDELAAINEKLRPTRSGTAQNTALLDQRDAALTVITEKLDVDISFQDNGLVDISRNGTSLVTFDNASPITFVANPGAGFDIEIGGSVQPSPTNGTLGGLYRAQSDVAAVSTNLDALAVQFADELNTWQANGRTDAGAAGAAIVSHGGTAASLTATGLTADDLALAASGGAANGNILALADLRTPTGTEQRYENIVVGQAQNLLSARSESEAATAFDRATRESRDRVSAVDLDREAADLIRLQQAYEASARIIQVARETVQSVLAIF